MISKACKYAIRAVIFVASRDKEEAKVSVKEIAKEIDAPEAFTAKTMQILNKHKIITSLKGPYGGFYVESFQMNQPILNIVNAIDGMSIFRECGLGLKQCSESHPCPMHFKFSKVRDELLKTFTKTTIKHLANNINEGHSFLKNIK